MVWNQYRRRDVCLKKKKMNSNFKMKAEFAKPRKLEDETVNYLQELEGQLESVEESERSIFIENLLKEISQRFASVISNRNVSYFIEKVCYLCDMKQLIEIMNHCIEYSLFLSLNRYSSHILQVCLLVSFFVVVLLLFVCFSFSSSILSITHSLQQAIISRLCYLIKHNEVEDDHDMSSLETAILSFVQPLLESFKLIANDISGSHVLRSVMCLLSGLPCISEKKGKNSKHQHAVSLSEPLETLLVNSQQSNEQNVTNAKRIIDSRFCFSVPSSFHGSFLFVSFF